MSTSDPIRISPGDIIDDFEIVDVIATGGSSTTYRANHRTLAREVSFKFVFPAVFSDDSGAIDAARADATRVARLEHPGVAPVFAAGSHGGGLYVASAMPSGRTVGALGAERLITPSATARVLTDVAAALQDAHDKGVVHRDLRPDCITMDRWGHGVVRDFGVTRTSGRTGLLTRAEILDSLRYTAPEVVLGRPATAASDVYGLAAVAVWCLTGSPPYADRPPGEYVRFRTSAPPPVLTDPDGMPATALNAALESAMSLDPPDRPSPVAFATAFGAAIAALPAIVRNAGCPLTVGEPAGLPLPAAESAFALPGTRDATRVEQRRPLPALDIAAKGPPPWPTYLACVMLALSAGIGGLLGGRASKPEPIAPLRIGAFKLELGPTWTRAPAAAGQRAGSVGLAGAAGEIATLDVSDAVRLPGDPLPKSLLPDRKARPRPASSGKVGLVTYVAADIAVLARPTTKGTLYAICPKPVTPGRCAALVVRAIGPGKDVPVLPSRPVSERVRDALRAVDLAGVPAVAKFKQRKKDRKAQSQAAQAWQADLDDAAAKLEPKNADPGTATALERLNKAIARLAGGAEALAAAIDKDSGVEFDLAAKELRSGQRALVRALAVLRRAGYVVKG